MQTTDRTLVPKKPDLQNAVLLRSTEQAKIKPKGKNGWAYHKNSAFVPVTHLAQKENALEANAEWKQAEQCPVFHRSLNLFPCPLSKLIMTPIVTDYKSLLSHNLNCISEFNSAFNGGNQGSSLRGSSCGGLTELNSL